MRKVKGTIHWVSAAHAVDAETRLYDRLFLDEYPDAEKWKEFINPNSLEILKSCKVEPSLAAAICRTVFSSSALAIFVWTPIRNREPLYLIGQ